MTEGPSVLADKGPDLTEWTASGFCAVFGVGLILLAWHYLRTDPAREDSPKAPSRADLYVTEHRRALAVLAEAGFLISLGRFVAVGFGIGWPGKWAGLALAWLAIAMLIALRSIGGPDWDAVPESMRSVVKPLFRAGRVAFFVLVLMFGWNQWRHQASSPVLESGFSTLLFGWAALTFAYGQAQNAEIR